MFISFPAVGHVNVSINLCKELADKNVKLLYYTLEEHFHKFEGYNNIEVRKYPDNFAEYYSEKAKISGKIIQNLVALLHMLYSFTDMLMPFLIKEVEKEKPDLIMCDPLSIWGKIVARLYNIPLALLFTIFVGAGEKKIPPGAIKSMLLNMPTFIQSMMIKKRIDKKYGNLCDNPPDIMDHQGEFTIVTTSKEFHPNGHAIPDNVRFMGPTNTEHSILPKDNKLIFVSIGTVQSNNALWEACINATKDLGYKVAITLAGNKQNKINMKTIPDHVTIYDNLTPTEYKNMISKSVLFISHGGASSVTDSILGMTPLLVCPGSDETYEMGRLVKYHKCGSFYPYKKIRTDKLREEIIKVLNDDSTKSGLEKMRQFFLNSMGCKKVVEELVKEFNLI
jgi:MGT family glycosyltransferase